MRIPLSTPELIRQKLTAAFPAQLKGDVDFVADFLFCKNFDIHPTVKTEIILDGQKLTIPGRIYIDDLKVTHDNLTTSQQTILNCILLRHHDGYVRQRYLESLVGNADDYFIIPYIFHLLGEYVMEILVVADKHINDKTIDNYLKFINENPKYRQQTESRMISYWNEHYRTKFRKRKAFIGQQIFDRIKKSEHAKRDEI